jgi:hypothetical protein
VRRKNFTVGLMKIRNPDQIVTYRKPVTKPHVLRTPVFSNLNESQFVAIRITHIQFCFLLKVLILKGG